MARATRIAVVLALVAVARRDRPAAWRRRHGLGGWGLDQIDGSEGDDEVFGRVDVDPDFVDGGPDDDTCRLGPNDPQPFACEQII